MTNVSTPTDKDSPMNDQYRDPPQPPAAPLPRDISASDLIEESANIETGRDRAATPMEDLRDQVLASVNQLVAVHAAGNAKQTAHWCGVAAHRMADMVREALGQAVVDKMQANQTKILVTDEVPK